MLEKTATMKLACVWDFPILINDVEVIGQAEIGKVKSFICSMMSNIISMEKRTHINTYV